VPAVEQLGAIPKNRMPEGSPAGVATEGREHRSGVEATEFREDRLDEPNRWF
jgi:hypothetical protein